MRPRFKLLSTQISQAFSKAGSFWYDTFGNPAQALKLVALAHQVSGLWRSLAVANDLSGSKDGPELVGNVMVSYKIEDVIPAGDVFYDQPFLTYGDDSSWTEDYGGGNVALWALPIKDVIPYAIQTSTRKLLAGIDFFVLKDTFLLFRQNPAELFEHQRFLVLRGRRPYVSLLARPAHAQIAGPVDQVVQYVRTKQTIGQFRLALAQLAGLAVLPTDQVLLHRDPGALETVYTFTNDVLRVNYPHVPLTEGKLYPAQTIIGPGIEVYYGDDVLPWWKAVDWKGGISLDPLLSTKGLFLFSTDKPAYAVNGDTTDLHARFPISESYWKDKAYWESVASKETLQGNYLNSAVGLSLSADQLASATQKLKDLEAYLTELQTKNPTTPSGTLTPFLGSLPGAKQINPMDVFFAAAFQPRAVVVTIDMQSVLDPAAVFRFLAEESPMGATMIVLAHNLQVNGDQLYLDQQPDHLIEIGPSLVPIDLSAVPTFSLNPTGNRVDFVTVKQDT